MTRPEFVVEEVEHDAVDDVWAFFQRLPDGDRTFVKQPVADTDTVRGWLSDDRSARFVVRRAAARPTSERDAGTRPEPAARDVIGYVALARGVGWSSHVGEIRLVIDPTMRRKGLGRMLARYALRVALDRGMTKVVVEVVAEQESTIALFTRLGFRREALLTDHVRDPAGRSHDLIVLAHHADQDAKATGAVIDALDRDARPEQG